MDREGTPLSDCLDLTRVHPEQVRLAWWHLLWLQVMGNHERFPHILEMLREDQPQHHLPEAEIILE